LGGVFYGCQCIQISPIRLEGNLRIAIQMRDSLGHGEPVRDDVSLALAGAANLELVRMIDHCLDA